MTDVSANTSTTAAVVDGVYRGQFETTNDVDWVAVELTAGVTYDIKGLGTDSDNGTAQYIWIDRIYSSTGVSLAHDP